MPIEFVVGLAAELRVAPWLRLAENVDRRRVLILLEQLAELGAGRSVVTSPVPYAGLVLHPDDEIGHVEVPSGACAECVYTAVEAARVGRLADVRARTLVTTALREAVVFFGQLDELAEDPDGGLAGAERQSQERDAEALSDGESADEVLARAGSRGEQLREQYAVIRHGALAKS